MKVKIELNLTYRQIVDLRAALNKRREWLEQWADRVDCSDYAKRGIERVDEIIKQLEA